MKSEKITLLKRLCCITPVLLVALVFGVNSQALAGLNLEVPIDMVDHGFEAPAGTGTTNFNRARIFLDANDYDGATYYFEIVAKNTDSSAKSVYFRRTTSTATYHATITVPAGTSNYTRYRVPLSINPLAGKNQYLVRLTQTTSAAQLIVSSARVIVQQTNATKTRIQIPLVEKNHDIYQVGSGRADTTTSAIYTQGDSDKFSLWLKNSSQYADISGWTLEAVLDNDSGTATTFAALHRASDGAVVADSEVSLLGSTIALVDTSFTNTATNFTDGSKFELKIRSSVSGQKAHLARASLYVSLTNLSKAEVLYRVSRKVASGPDDVVGQRMLLDTTLFTSPEIYFEATGRCADNTPLVFLRDHDANPSGTGGTDVSGSGINFNNANRDIVRTAAIAPDSGDNFYVRVATNTSTLKVTHAWVVVVAPSASCPTPGTPISPTPADGATGQLVDVDLDWSDCSDTDSYDVYFGTSASPLLYASGVIGSSYTLPTHEYCTKYYWKIVAKNDAGCSTPGDIWDFTTENGPPGTPSNPSPADGTTDVSINAVLDWSDCTGTDTYEVYLDENPTPTTKVGETADSTFDPNLDFSTHYYWKIVAKNSCGSSTAGAIWDFTTGSGTSHYVDGILGNDGNSPYELPTEPAKTIQAAIDVCINGTVYVKKTTGIYGTIDMKSNVYIVGTDGSGGEPASRDDYPTLYSGPVHNPPSTDYGRAPVRLLGPLSNCKLAYFKVTGGKMEEGQIYVSGVHGEIGNDVIIEKCWLYNGSHVGINLRGAAAPTIRDCDIEDPITSGISSFKYGIDPTSSPVIIRGCNLSGSGADWGLRSGIRLAGSGSGTQATIGGSAVDDGNTISNNGYAGIRLDDIDEVSIENNDISNNGRGGILLVDASTVSPHIRNNDIHHHVNAGINIGGASNVTIGDNNDIYNNNTGIAFYVSNNSNIGLTKSSQPVIITGNNIFLNTDAGIAVRDGIGGATTITQNNIYSNTRAGIRIQRKCTLDINRNDIHDNLRGGIHTGSDVADGGGFAALQIGLGFLTIEKNKIYNNGAAGYGGGIDVRHMPGTIYNNLVYNNYKGGIRFGDYITEIINNTVVGNGNASGGGIAYDDLAGAVNADAAGVPPAPLLILNNISVYNHKAGIRACFDNTEGSEERDYNLVYANRPWNDTFNRANAPDCGWPTLDDMSCIRQQYGGCGAYFLKGVGIVLDDPNDIIADPKFVEVDPDYYQLLSDSPAKNAGDDGYDMGAYGGSDPIDW